MWRDDTRSGYARIGREDDEVLETQERQGGVSGAPTAGFGEDDGLRENECVRGERLRGGEMCGHEYS